VNTERIFEFLTVLYTTITTGTFMIKKRNKNS